MDLILLFVILVLVIIFFRNAKSLIYALGIVEIFLHIVNFIKHHIGTNELSKFLEDNVPNSILNILDKHSDGILYDLLSWCFVACMVWFLIYLLKYLFKGK